MRTEVPCREARSGNGGAGAEFPEWTGNSAEKGCGTLPPKAVSVPGPQATQCSVHHVRRDCCSSSVWVSRWSWAWPQRVLQIPLQVQARHRWRPLASVGEGMSPRRILSLIRRVATLRAAMEAKRGSGPFSRRTTLCTASGGEAAAGGGRGAGRPGVAAAGWAAGWAGAGGSNGVK